MPGRKAEGSLKGIRWDIGLLLSPREEVFVPNSTNYLYAIPKEETDANPNL